MGLLGQEPLARFWAWMEHTGWVKLQHLALVLLACVAFLYAIRLVSKAVRRAVDDGNDDVTTEAERRADTLGSVLRNAARVVAAVFFLLMTLQEFGINIGPLVAGAGIAGVALGFGAQSLVKDVISGFFLLMENQFAVGDLVSIDDGKHLGHVERMTLRITQLRDSEGRAHFIPNGAFTKVVVLSKDYSKALVDVEVGYDADLDRVMGVLREIGAAMAEDLPDLVLEPTDVKGVEAFGKDGCTIRTYTKTAPGRQAEAAREYRKRIIGRFRLEGIASPIPQRIVHTKAAGEGAAEVATD
ncbi:MAG: mechanosensitive ion channel family protein [Holophagaceae bacterium]